MKKTAKKSAKRAVRPVTAAWFVTANKRVEKLRDREEDLLEAVDAMRDAIGSMQVVRASTVQAKAIIVELKRQARAARMEADKQEKLIDQMERRNARLERDIDPTY
jgi:hypothetical protein